MAAKADDVRSRMERRHARWVARARETAVRLARERGRITIDDVRKVAPPPPDADPRILGLVFIDRQIWRPDGWVESKRGVCHRRPIRRWRLAAGRS